MTDSAVVALGVAVAMIYDRRTGYGCGGLITPGVTALTLYHPARALWGLAAALVVWGLLELGVRRFGWYGRQRMGWALLLSLALRGLAGSLSPEALWIGWVVPGLVAADIQRQGLVETLSAAATATVVTAFGAQGMALVLSWWR